MRPFYKHTKKLQTWLLPAPISSATPSRHGSVQVGNKHYGWGCLCRVLVKFTWMITLSGLLGRKRRGSRIFTQTLAKRLIFPTCLFASETWVGLGNFSCEAVRIRRIMWALFFSSLYFIFAFLFPSQKFIENTGVPEGGLELVLDCFSFPFDLGTWCPYHQSKTVIQKKPQTLCSGPALQTSLLDLLIAVHCTALLLPAKASPFPGLNSGRWGHPPTVEG